MNPNTLRKFDKMLARMDRRAKRPPRRFLMSPIALVAGLVLGEQLLVRFVPMVWETFLPGGLEQADFLRGWPGLLWRLAVSCHVNQPAVFVGIGVVGLVAWMLGGRNIVFRFLVRLGAFGVILLDACIVIVTLATSYRITADNSGIPGL
jgi:hypothetical protein